MKNMPTIATRTMQLMLCAVMCAGTASAFAQQLATKFSCSQSLEQDDERVIYSDHGEIRLNGNRINTFRWESALFRPEHGFDCSIDETDGLQVEVTDAKKNAWRIGLADARAARNRRGYDFVHGINCSIHLQRNGDRLSIKPNCPALCGARVNFSELSVDLKTGKCRYEK